VLVHGIANPLAVGCLIVSLAVLAFTYGQLFGGLITALLPNIPAKGFIS
jgi:hypothetical protein